MVTLKVIVIVIVIQLVLSDLSDLRSCGCVYVCIYVIMGYVREIGLKWFIIFVSVITGKEGYLFVVFRMFVQVLLFFASSKKSLNFPFSLVPGRIVLKADMARFLQDFCGCPSFLGHWIQAPNSFLGR